METSAKIMLTQDGARENISLPNQRVSRKKKNTETWQHDSIDFFINNKDNHFGSRKTKSDMNANWNFYNSYLATDDLTKTLDPLGVEQTEPNPDDDILFKFYNILDQPFDTIFGEELKRHSEVKAYSINPTIINAKDNEFKGRVKDFLADLATQDQGVDEEELKIKLKEYDKFKKNDLQSAHEKMVNSIIQTLINNPLLNTKLTINQGFKNLEIIGEEIFRIGHSGKELTLDAVNSSTFSVLGMGRSPFISDGYAWIEEDKMNPHKIIEEFSDDLTNVEIDDILKLSNWDSDSMRPHRIGLVNVTDPDDPHTTQALPLAIDNKFITIDGDGTADVDEDGNITVYRIQWLSLRKLGVLTFYDEYGDQQETFVDEYYIPDVTQGEEVKWIWINELWEGCKIGTDIYKKIRPCPVQMRSSLNPSIVRPSYVGYVLSNQGIAQQSRLDKLRPYQELFNVWVNKLVKTWTEHIGKAIVIDVAKIPSGMSTEEWYIWLKRFNIAFENSFEEGKKGMAKGMIAGQMQQSSRTIDVGVAEEMNTAIQMLSWIENKVNQISAIPEARQGATSGNEGLGVTQQSIVQSSHQTENDFAVHDIVKSRVYELMIEYTKVLWKDEKGKRQYLLSDLSNHILDVDGDLLNESDYGIVITNSSQLYAMYTAVQQLVHAAMQTGTATLSDVARMYMATSPSQMLHELEEAEDKRLEQQNEQARMQQETAQAQSEAMAQLEQIKHQNELAKLDKEWAYRLQIEQIKAAAKYQEHSTDTNQNNIEDQIELEKEQIKADSDRILQSTEFVHEKDMQDKDLKSKKEIEVIKSRNKTVSKTARKV